MASILVADDEDMIRETLRIALTRAGHEVTVARNGRIATKMVADGTFDLLIVDIIMPEKEGIETILDVRKLRPDLKIIVMSGGGRRKSMESLRVAERLGADVALAKPFNPRQLLMEVGRLLSAG